MAALCLVLATPPAMAQSAPSTRVSQLMSTTTVEDATSTAAPTATVAPSYKLDDVLAVVLLHNPELRQAQQARISAMAATRGAQAYVNPKLEVTTGRNQARLPGTSSGSVLGFGVAQLIENPSARQARIDVATAAAQGSEHAIGIARNGLVNEVRLRAAEYLLRQAESGVSTEDLTLLEDVRERVRVRVSSGEAPRYELIKADAEIVQARERAQHSRLQAEQVLVGLNRLAAGQLPPRWSLQGSLMAEPAVPSLDELRQLTETRNPELHALRAELTKAQARADGARASRWPGVELRLGQSREPDVRHSTLGVGVQLPVFDTRQAAIDEAASEVIRAQTRLEGRQAELQQELNLAWQSLDMARLRVRALGEGVIRDAEAALKVAQAAYRFGERGILEVLDAQRVLRAARIELLRARFQVQAALIELDTLAGKHAQANTPQP